MQTTTHPIPLQAPVAEEQWLAPPADVFAAPPPPVGADEAWSDAPPDGAPGPTSTVLMVLGSAWPFVVVLAGLVLIVPFVAGLAVVGLAGAILALPVLLVRHLRRDRESRR